MWAGGQTDMRQLTVTLQNFPKKPKNQSRVPIDQEAEWDLME